MDFTFQFAPDATAAAHARGAISVLETMVEPWIMRDLRYVVTELMTNAVVHGPGDADVQLKLRLIAPTKVAGEVVDNGEDAVVAIRRGPSDAMNGRGLQIVEALTTRWGTYGGSTHVWFEIG